MIKRQKLGDEEVGEEHPAMAMSAAAFLDAQRLKKRVELPHLPAPEKADEGVERRARGRLKFHGAQ